MNEKITEISTPLYPQLTYAIPSYHSVMLARVQMSYIYCHNSMRETPFHTTFQDQLADAWYAGRTTRQWISGQKVFVY